MCGTGTDKNSDFDAVTTTARFCNRPCCLFVITGVPVVTATGPVVVVAAAVDAVVAKFMVTITRFMVTPDGRQHEQCGTGDLFTSVTVTSDNCDMCGIEYSCDIAVDAVAEHIF